MKDEHDHSAIGLWTHNKLLFFVSCFNVWLHSAAHVFARCHKSRQLHIWVIFSFLTQPPRHLCRLCRPQQLNRIRRQLLDQKQSILERWWQLIHKGDITAHLASGVDLKWLFEKLPFLCIPPLSFAQYSGYFSSMYCLSDIRGSSGP